MLLQFVFQYQPSLPAMLVTRKQESYHFLSVQKHTNHMVYTSTVVPQ